MEIRFFPKLLPLFSSNSCTTTLVWKWIVSFLLFAATLILAYQFLDIPLQVRLPNNLFESHFEDHAKLQESPSTSSNGNMCPEYFRWIHEDLRPWKNTGITKEMVESGKEKADFRMIIVDGRVFIKTYRRSFQTRDIFSQWGILQLLKQFPGKLPDIDVMFDCSDIPQVKVLDYKAKGIVPPPLFHYCADKTTMDIVFPDWSFWGWPEVNVKPWVPLMEELKEGNKKIKWEERDPFAYWKGNAYTSRTRTKLLSCNGNRPEDWNARIYQQDWSKESSEGFKNSNLADQCTHRYKIYADGRSWSVSKKYIMACDSPTLMVEPTYYDFFTRSLIPLQHYWPIRSDDHICSSIKFAVNWGNSHAKVVKAIGESASDFVEKQLKMDYVYDYMFHLLNEYSKLLKYKPQVPEGNEEFHCLECMDCTEQGLVREFMNATMVKRPRNETEPVCTLPPPFATKDLQLSLKSRKAYADLVKSWERQS